MSENNLSQLEKKKQALEIELARIQTDLDRSIDGVKENVSSNFAPKAIIRKYPLPALGAALVLGLLLGKGKKKSSKSPQNKKDSSDGVGSVVGREIKNALTKKSVHMLMDYLDNRVSRLNEKSNEKSS
ncbi:MAG: hypothetical protein WD059_14460 [Balneolaceae bacterium]